MGRKFASLFYLEEFLIATYSKPSNEGLLFYSMTRRPTRVDFVITTISEMHQEHRVFLYFLSLIVSMLPFPFLLIASRFCIFYQKRRSFSLHIVGQYWVMRSLQHGREAGKWMSVKEDRCHDWFRPAMIHLLEPGSLLSQTKMWFHQKERRGIIAVTESMACSCGF